MSLLERVFKLSARNVTVKSEVIAGFSTFLTMAYIMLVNPVILSHAGMNLGATFVATCLVTALACFLTGVLSNYPLAVAPAMAMNAYFAFVVVQGMGYSWQTGLGSVFIASSLFFLVIVTPMRRWLLDAIPHSMSMAIAAGLGFFIALLGLRNGGLIVSDPNTLLKMGDVHSISVLLFFLGFCLIVALDYLRVRAAMIIGIIVVTILGIIFKQAHFQGFFSLPPSIAPSFMQLNFHGLWSHNGLAAIFAFFLISLFDSTGTFIGILHQAGLFTESKKDYRALTGGLLATSTASMIGGVLGTSSTSPYCESAAGIRAGGRTGLTSCVVSILFLACLFFSPLANTVPSYATAGALLFVGCLMMKSFTHFNWEDMTETIPSVITAVMIPLSFSIAVGIGMGFVSYVVIKLFSGKIKTVHPVLIVWAGIFVVYFLSGV